MTNNNCCCKADCTGVAVVASIIIGIITAFLRFSATITVTPAFLWVTLGIGVVYLAVTLFVSLIARGIGIRGCICSTLPVLLIGILGAILTSLVLLAITFVATSVIGAIITGLLLAFLSITLSTTACLARCITGCNDD